jgi:hypothetical protein
MPDTGYQILDTGCRTWIPDIRLFEFLGQAISEN